VPMSVALYAALLAVPQAPSLVRQQAAPQAPALVPQHISLQEPAAESETALFNSTAADGMWETANFCLSTQVYDTLFDAAAASNRVRRSTRFNGTQIRLGSRFSPTTSTIVFCFLLVMSLILLFFGQYLAIPSLGILAYVVTTVVMFICLHILLAPTDEFMTYGPYSRAAFAPCMFPVAGAIGIGLILAVLLVCVATMIAWVASAIFGFVLGGIAMYLLRNIIVAAVPAVLEDHAINFFWVGALVVALASGIASALCVSKDGSKSFIIILASSGAGGYGTALALSSLVNLYVGEGFASLYVLVTFLCLALTGFLFQYFLTGDDAKQHRETTRRRIRGEPSAPPVMTAIVEEEPPQPPAKEESGLANFLSFVPGRIGAEKKAAKTENLERMRK